MLCIASLARAASPPISLADAARKGDRPAVRALLQRQSNPNTPSGDGTTPLHWAVQHDDVEMVDLLLKAGADAKTANRYGATSLYVACQNGNAAVVERLLKAGADANAALPEGETALMTAARTGKVETVKLLLAHGATASAQEKWRGQTALMWAAAENHTGVVQTLIEAGADLKVRSNGGFTPLLFAVRAGRLETVRELLAKGADPNEAIQGRRGPRRWPRRLQTPAAATGGAIGNAAGGRLSNNSSDPLATLFQVFNTGSRASGRTGPGTNALVMAIMNGHFELASELVDSGADPERRRSRVDRAAPAGVDPSSSDSARPSAASRDRQNGQPRTGPQAARQGGQSEREDDEGAL